MSGEPLTSAEENAGILAGWNKAAAPADTP
jgi:hypothetical protein